jgi:farnesyl diphosphate synthase/geranylgeranyl diphosphate synthase type II
MEALQTWWEPLRRRYDAVLVEHLEIPGRLGDVASYALAGGKRVRPLMAEAMGEAVGARGGVMRVGVAVEYLHAASLLLDDLPTMDHARERRGAEPAHLRFSEADAMLAAIALVGRAYAVGLGDGQVGSSHRPGTARGLSETIVAMAAGQSLELSLDGAAAAGAIEQIHRSKTAALFVLVARLVATEVGLDEATSAMLARFAEAFGGAYQIGDDLQDADAPGEQRGNLARALGADAARERAAELLREAVTAIAPLGDAAARLVQCAEWLAESLAPVHGGR